MRLNKFIAASTGLSRRAADQMIEEGRVTMNGQPAAVGTQIKPSDKVLLNGQEIKPFSTTIILLNKPVGYVCSRHGQGSRTIYDLLPKELHRLKPVGRLDKDSSGLLVMSNDGDLANQLTHPRYAKSKLYEIQLDRELEMADLEKMGRGVKLEDGPSKLQLLKINNSLWQVKMNEGRNRQIRRTFAALGYEVIKLHRTHFGPYKLDDLASGHWHIQH